MGIPAAILKKSCRRTLPCG